MSKYLAIILLLLPILGCSTGEGDDIQNTRIEDVQENVALNTTVTASYDSANADIVVDGDSTTSNYWSGNIPGDYLVVDLGKINNITRIVVYTNETSISTVNPPITFELSPDGANWYQTLLFSGGDIPCTTEFGIGSGSIRCNVRPGIDGYIVNNSQQMRYFRATVNSSDVGLIQIYEVEITGWVKKTTVIN